MRHNQPGLGGSKLPVGRNRELMRTRWYDALIEHEVALIFQWPVNSWNQRPAGLRARDDVDPCETFGAVPSCTQAPRAVCENSGYARGAPISPSPFPAHLNPHEPLRIQKNHEIAPTPLHAIATKGRSPTENSSVAECLAIP